jgi:phosphoribosylformylglycinamidine synthase
VLSPADVPPPADYAEAVLKIMSCPDMASKRWIWEQYDRHVMADTLEDSATAADAAVVRVHGTQKALAMTSDVNPRYVAADPYEGGKQAVAEAWRNLTAVGADPIAVTDNLNFGNPERPEIMGQIVAAIDGMAEACRALDFPVVSGNVSLYNETSGVGIPPTPTVGAVGLLPDYSKRTGYSRLEAGETLILIGKTQGHLGASLYLRECLGREEGAPPPVDLLAEKRAGDFVRALIRDELPLKPQDRWPVVAVHDLSDGGLIGAVCDIALASGVEGVNLYAPDHLPLHAWLFGEDQGRYLLVLPTDFGQWTDLQPLLDAAAAAGLQAEIVGEGTYDFAETGRENLEVFRRGAHDPVFALPLARLREANEAWLPAYMGETA